jgi:hypothetical protein
VCEACTVRSVLQRELTDPSDVRLLALERMRILDMAHSWARQTHSAYQGKLRLLHGVASALGVPLYSPSPLPHPRSGVDITLMWCQEAYSLQQGASRLGPNNPVSFGSIRQLRSALSHLLAWDNAHAPSPGYLDKGKRLINQKCRPTDALPMQLHAQGMAARLGTETSPSKALLDRHVRHLMRDLSQAYHHSLTARERQLAARASVATLLLWLGWLRGGELFGLRWSDITLTLPSEGPIHDLPPGIGMVGLQLSPETKSQRTRAVDMSLAYETISGYQLGLWIRRLQETLGLSRNQPHNHTLIFQSAEGVAWTSQFYRDNFLYPSLYRQQAMGDPALVHLPSVPGAFWSLHSFRSGARSQVSRRRATGPSNTRKATPMEVYEHGRWRKRRAGEPIDIMYQQWNHFDRLQLTLCCM